MQVVSGEGCERVMVGWCCGEVKAVFFFHIAVEEERERRGTMVLVVLVLPDDLLCSLLDIHYFRHKKRLLMSKVPLRPPPWRIGHLVHRRSVPLFHLQSTKLVTQSIGRA